MESIGVKCYHIFYGLDNEAIRVLQIGAGFRDCKSRQEGLQIGISNWDKKISNRGKQISNRGKRDYKPGQGLQIGPEQSKIEPKKR